MAQTTKPKSNKRKRRILALVLALLFLWVFWPIYGFLSNQYETARLPWGWSALPSKVPQTSDVPNPAYVDAAAAGMELLMKRRADIQAPSLSAAVAIEGEIVWAGAIGWSDIANEVPVDTATTYRIGSTSKAVGITGLARLTADGIIDLDTPISTYSNDLPNAEWKAFTAKQLASHTAGLAAYEENNDWIGFYQSLALTTRYTDPEKALSVFDDADTLFSPGDKFHYSGFDNVLLSAVMQSAAAEPFDDYMSKRVFEPLGLTSTVPDHKRNNEMPFAKSYQVKGDKFKRWRKVDLSHKLAAGGYISTPTELAKLGAAWMDDDFIPEAVRAEFWTPVKLTSGEVNEQDYALGFRRKTWPIDGVGDVVHLNHGGVSKGAQTWLMIVPEYKLSLAISTNRRTDVFFDFADVYVDLLEVFIPVIEPE